MRHLFTFPRLVALVLAGAALSAQAHTGHGTHGLMQGLIHPFGVDHLLAMLAVGVWSVCALPAAKAWQGPASFLSALIVGATLGALGLSLPFLEHAIALSVVLFGLMLILASRTLPGPTGPALIALAAALHGLAHGAEAPATDLAAYALGFLLSSAALHISGVAVGLSLRHALGRHNMLALSALGAMLGGAGLAMFAQI